MGIKLNLTGEEIKAAQGGAFPPLAEGTYGAVIYDAKFGQSKAKNDMYTITFKINEGPEGINRQLKGWFTLTPAALFKVVELNKAVGFPYPTKDTPAGEFEFNDAEDYLGKQVNIVIVQEAYESVDEETGEDITAYRNNVKYVRKYDPDKISGASEAAVDKSLFL